MNDLTPHRIDDRAWWYAEAQKLSIVVEPDSEGRTRIVEIPWRKIRVALSKLDKK